jgi:hypothetical protein
MADSAVAPTVTLKPGQEAVFTVTVLDGRVTPGVARRANVAATEPKEGEIAVSVARRSLSPYVEVTATEKTPAPVDFVATGLIGDIKIDEIVICGRLDAPATARIASGAWTISLNRFSVRENDAECQR